MQKFKNRQVITRSILFILLISTSLLYANDQLEKADSLFSLRNKNFDTKRLLADKLYIDQSIKIYKDVLVNTTDPLLKKETLWKLLRSYFFKGQFGSDDEDIKQEIFNEGIEIGETYITQIPESVEAYMWLSLNWARWAEVSGILSAAMNNVAGKLKEYAEKIIALDEYYLDAGGYRLLGSLHISVPYIPFILTWPSNKEGLLNLEKAYKLAPYNLYNKMYLAMALHSEGQNERSKSLLLEIINTKEIVHDLAIDLFIKKEAEDYLSKEF